MSEKMPVPESPEKVDVSLPENFDDVVSNLKFQKKRDPTFFVSTMNEIRNMAKGGNDGGVREEYYPGWTDDHFKKLIEAVEGK